VEEETTGGAVAQNGAETTDYVGEIERLRAEQAVSLAKIAEMEVKLSRAEAAAAVTTAVGAGGGARPVLSPDFSKMSAQEKINYGLERGKWGR